MFAVLLTSPVNTLRPHFWLSKTRFETPAVLLLGLVNTRTVNLSHLASRFPGDALHNSNYRRLQRFFLHVRLNEGMAVQLIMRMLKLLDRSRLLALDRTNRKPRSANVNIPVPAVVTRRFRIPLMWTLTDPCRQFRYGIARCADAALFALVWASSINALLADKEFAGSEWMKFLFESNIPFVIRLKEDMLLHLEDRNLRQFRTLLCKYRSGAWTGWLKGMEKTSDNRLHFAAKRIKGGEALIIAARINTPGRALSLYRKRWEVEYLFADAKIQGNCNIM